MRSTRLAIITLAVPILAVGLLLQPGRAGDQKNHAWKHFLPAEVYKELVGRELKTVEAALGKEDARDIQKGKVAALMIAAATLSTSDPSTPPLPGVRAAAFHLALILGDKAKTDEAKKLAAAIATGKTAAPAADAEINFRKLVPKEYDLMVMYMGKVKGGDGLHPEIQQLSPRLQKGEEYIENLFAYLGKKALKDALVKKGAKELELVGWRTAVSAELILAYVPKNKTTKRNPAVWLKTGTAMRDGALALAEAAHKQDAAGIQQASAAILDSCVKCHKMFQ